jgi:hypothetical protein
LRTASTGATLQLVERTNSGGRGAMHHRRMRARWAVLALSVGLVSVASGAFACTNLATVNLSASAGRPGDVVTLTGSGFQASTDEMPMDDMAMTELAKGGTGTGSTAGLAVRSPVVLRWDGPDGPVLADAVPDRSGTVSVVFAVPVTKSGSYSVVAVQKNPQGVDVYGTPARAPFEVLGVGQQPGAEARGSGSEGAGQPSSTGRLLLTAGLGVLGLALLAAGGSAATRVVGSRREVPVKAGGKPS